MRRARVYLAQVNHQYGDNVFLPYSVGLLWAFARQDPEVARHYELAEFLFLREPVDTAVARMKKPDVVGISCYIWNASYSNALAAAVKRSFPDCLIVMGGPEIPTASSGFFTRHPYVTSLSTTRVNGPSPKFSSGVPPGRAILRQYQA
jgi:hypothetical protein